MRMSSSINLASRVVLACAAAILTAVVMAKNPVAASTAPAATLPTGNAANGQKLYAICMGCHSIDENDVGPRHRGVVGRMAGRVPGYAYSPALAASKIVWTPQAIDQWLRGPSKMVPGTKMFFSVAKAQDRADIISYLATQK